MAITVQDIVSMDQLACSVVAGVDGLARPVLWAHSCELADPWTWLGRDELLMTVGICVPSGEQAQVRFIEQLDAKGIAGVALGDHLVAPPLTSAMLAKADELRFPVLSVRHTTPFAALARTVAIASQSEQLGRITRLGRLYELARLTTPGGTALLERLSAELGYALHVVDVEYGTEVLAATSRLPAGVVGALRAAVTDVDRLPPRISVTAGDGTATAFALSTHRRCVMVIESGDVDLDAFVILHAQSLVGVEVERTTRERERTDRLGETLLGQLVDGKIGGEAASPRLEQAGLTTSPWQALAFTAVAVDAARAVLSDDGVAYLSLVSDDTALLLCARDDADGAVTAVREHADAIGVSAPIADPGRISEGAREARWALESARSRGAEVADYSDSAPLFLPRTVEEARFATRVVLGPLLDHDRAKGTELVRTLRVFLDGDRNWSGTAEALRIHRQTLGYRLRTIESLTGRSTRKPADIAMFWMALAALDIAGEG
ncbi:PucR family transcriptional regulator [Prauserella flavalba]|uniref:PucR family transcriptional regulator n=1 Tax=Prauserella flavalba TaxID=1477506 RepID=UPI0036EDF26A